VVELGVAEDERIGLVDQRGLDLVAELLRHGRRQLEPAEAGSQNEDARVHAAIILTAPARFSSAGHPPPSKSRRTRYATNTHRTHSPAEPRRPDPRHRRHPSGDTCPLP